MKKHSVAEAKNYLPRLIDSALKGETVIITRHGHGTVQLTPLAPTPRPVSPEGIAWLERNCVGERPPGRAKRAGRPNAAELIRMLRDED